MKPNKTLAIALALVIPFAALATGQQTSGTQEKRYSPRGEAVYSIVKRWGPHVQEAYKIDMGGWAKEMGPVFAGTSLDRLAKAARAEDFDAMNSALLGKASYKTISPKALGDAARDLVFVPVTPCRIFDTRLAGGQIAANTVRGVDVTAVSNYSFQGGAANDCGGVGAAGSFAAAAINFTVVSPAAAGYITAYPIGTTQPLAATVNFTPGSIVGNYAVVKLDQGAAANELSVYSFANTHLVADIVGYYIAPVRSPMDCIEKESASTNIGPGGVGSISSPVCDAGYTVISGGCTSSTFDGRIVSNRTFASSNNHFCAFRNEGAGTMQAVVYARCCRSF